MEQNPLQTVDDTRFVEIILDSFENNGPEPERYFFSKIAGMTHHNRDGSNRIHCMYGCRTGDQLELRREPDNPVDPKAVAVYRKDTGKQLGFLPEQTAHELIQRTEADGGSWIVVFKDPYMDELQQSVVGATIFLLYFSAGPGA